MENLNPRQLRRSKRVRRTHSREFKVRLIALAEASEVSVPKSAMDNQINANQLRKWISESHSLPASQKMQPVSIADTPLNTSNSASDKVFMELNTRNCAIIIHHGWDPLAVAALTKALK